MSDPHPKQQPLTPKTLAVLGHLAHGLTYIEIAALLGISPRTVKKHVKAAVYRLGAANRTEAVAMATRTGLI